MIGAEIYQADQNLGIERDIYNYTEEKIKMPQINISENHPIERTQGVINEGRIFKIVESFINFLLVTTEQVSKMGIEFGYQHPNLNFKLIWKYLIIIFIIVIVVMLLKPLGYLIILLILLGMWISDKRKERRKKKYKNIFEEK